MRRLIAAVAALLTSVGLAMAQPAPATPDPSTATGTTYIQAGRLLADPATGQVLTGQTIVVVDGRVTEIRPGYVGSGRVVDLRDAFVLPGLIDSHVHLTSQQGPNSRLEEVTQTAADQAMRGALHARRTLMAGFTTVADLGADNAAIFALRDAVATGEAPGPRILAAGQPICAHGGHCDVHGFRPDVMEPIRPTSVCSGADDCRRAVREQVRLGADLIKVMATGGVLSNTAAGLNQQLTDEELRAIVETAHMLGRRVTAHAHGAGGIDAFLRAGGDSIEHGTYLDDEGIRLLRQPGRYLVPTLMAGDFVYRIATSPNNFLTPAQTAKALEAGPRMIEMVRRAAAAGVRIAYGTDTGVSAHGDNAGEFALLVRAGLTPMQAIQAATVNAADHLQIADVAGRIAAGRPADIVAVRGDPLADASVFTRMAFVMRGGVIYRSDPAASQ